MTDVPEHPDSRKCDRCGRAYVPLDSDAPNTIQSDFGTLHVCHPCFAAYCERRDLLDQKAAG